MSHYISSLVKLAERAADENEEAFDKAAVALSRATGELLSARHIELGVK